MAVYSYNKNTFIGILFLENLENPKLFAKTRLKIILDGERRYFTHYKLTKKKLHLLEYPKTTAKPGKLVKIPYGKLGDEVVAEFDY